jgi:serine/threonine protein kinase
MVIPETEVIASLDGREIYRAVHPPGDYVIGRDPDVQIRLPSVQVSRRHAQLSLNYFDWSIEDFGSANGTFLGKDPIREMVPLFPQQEVRLGDVVLTLRRLPMPYGDADELSPQTEAVLRYLPFDLRGMRRYKIHRTIARGGMGVVLEAEDLSTRRRVAMKVLLEIRSAQDVARFVEEAQITAQLEHPNIIPVHDLNVNELDQPFYTMKLVQGESLQDVLDGLRAQKKMTVERYPLQTLLSVFNRVANAIAFAHSKGVVHRDIKPDNVMLGAFGETLVMDWGLAKPLPDLVAQIAARGASRAVKSTRQEDTAQHTMIGSAIGTPRYMSPEQASGESHAVDLRADIYGLGALLYCLLTLQPPVENGDPSDVLEKVVAGEVVPPEEKVRAQPPIHLPKGAIPPRLSEIAMKALALDPRNRFQTVAEMQRALAG